MKQLLIWISIFTLLVMACGMSAGTQPESKISIKVNTPSLEPAPTPIRAVTESGQVCGFWNIRSGASADSASIGIVLSGNTVNLTGVEATAFDGGKWVQIKGRDGTGWMNAKGLCEVVK